ncbi:hypothetical protein [Ideonella sp.]|jgi:uncharacterized protein involved in exopolysaccharide biosynthesis|uniref:hypothetical protein n=1 Tax=Ideonella sp. TaxID=1929293 RepID=UPI0037C12E1F
MTLQDGLAMLARQAILILITMAVLTAVTLWLLGGQKKVYTTTARIWIQTEQQGTPAFLSGLAAYRDSPYPDPVARKIETEMELLMTRSNAADVIRRFKLTEGQLAFKPMDHVKNKVSKLLGIEDDYVGEDAKVGPPVDALVDQLLKGIKISPRRSGTADTSSNVLEIELESTDGELAPKILAALIEGYLKLSAEQSQQQATTTSRLIERQMIQARDELRAVEGEMTEVLMRQARRAEADGTGGSLVTARTGASLQGEADGGSGQLKNHMMELQIQLDQARQLYTDDAEPVKAVKRRLAAAEARLRQGMGDGVRTNADLGRLERQRNLAQERYVELRKRLDQIELYLQANQEENQARTVVDNASAASGSGKAKQLMLMVLGPILGLALGLLLAGVREFMDGRMRSPKDVRQTLGLPVLGQVSELSRKARRSLEQHRGG